MAKDVIARLKVDDKGWNNGFTNAEKTLKKFADQNLSVEGAVNSSVKSLVSAASRYASFGAAVAAAMKVAKDAFMANEVQADEWGRTLQASENLYKGFLNSLNNSDISGFLKSMNDIVSSARDAYDAMDELNTFRAFNQVNSAKNRAGYAEALEEYKANPTAENKKALTAANARVVAELNEEAKLANNAYTSNLSGIAATKGLSGDARKQFMQLFQSKSFNELKEMQKGYEENWNTFQTGYLGKETTYNGKRVTNINGQGAYVDKSGGISKYMTAQEQTSYQLARVLSQLNDEQIKEFQQLGAETYQLKEAAAQQTRSFNRLAGNNGKVASATGGTKTTKTTAANEETVKELTGLSYIPGLSSMSTGESMADLKSRQSYWENQLNTARNGYEIGQAQAGLKGVNGQIMELQAQFVTSDDVMADFKEKVEDWLKADGGIKLPVKADSNITNIATTAKGMAGSFQAAASAMGNFASTSEEAAKASQAFTIASAIATLVGQFASIPKGAEIWSWIAGTVAGVGTLTAAIASIKSASSGSYAEGGIVPGAYNGGNDSTYVYASPGELILNRSQQNNLAGQLAGGSSETRVVAEAEKLITIINNHGRRTGRGELLFG